MSKKRKTASVESTEVQETPVEEPVLLADILDGEHGSEFGVQESLSEESAPEPSVVEDNAPTVSSQVAIVNLDMGACYVPVQGGSIRLGPKSSKVVSADDVTEETRQLARHGRIQLRNL